MAIKTPNYVLISEVAIYYGVHDKKIIPQGSFVRPIEYQYVPAHVTDSKDNKFFDKSSQIFCYTKIGIVPVDRSNIREV